MNIKIWIMALAMLLMLCPANSEAQEVHGKRELDFGVLEYTIRGIRNLKYDRDSTATVGDFHRTYSYYTASFPFYYEKWDDFKEAKDEIVVDATFTPFRKGPGRGCSLHLATNFFTSVGFGEDANHHIHYAFQIEQDDRFELHSGRMPVYNITLTVNKYNDEGTHIGGHFELINISYKPLEEDEGEEDVGPHYEEDNDAWGFDGVWPFTIPASVIIGLLGYTLTKGKPKEEEGGEDPKHPDPREMHIYKAFGNTLMAGDAPRQVFAKIVRKPKKGGEMTDVAMTSLIQITPGDQYMQVKDGGMYHDWRTAWIEAPDTDTPPDEGIVVFRMGNEGGSYTNRLHFKVDAGEVLFGQDNLTLPAHYEKEVRLPFVVLGMDDSQKDIEASILDSAGNPTKNYDLQVEWNEKEQLYYAIIHDCVLDETKDKGVPGKYLSYTLRIKGQHKGGKPIEGNLPIFRYYMGLIFDAKDVKCFIEEYKPMNHFSDRFVATQNDGKQYVPAETKTHMRLYDYDEEKHKILVICPVPCEFSIKAQDEGKQEMVDKLAIQLDVKGGAGTISEDKNSQGTFALLRCCRAVLDAPNRIGAIIKVGVMHKGEKVTCEQAVRLCSQPVRQFDDNRSWNLAVKEDERITERLNHIESEIYRHHLVNNLFPLLKYINMVRDGYHPDYGYDPKTIKTIVTTYTDVMTGRKMGANAEPPKPLTLADDFKMFCMAWFETAKKTNEEMGFLTRLFVGVCTLGCSDVVFTAVEIVDNMKEYVDKGGDSVWGGFCVGAKVAVREYITEKLMNKGMEKLGKAAKEAGLTPENMKKAMGEMVDDIKNPFSTSSKGGILKRAANNSKNASKRAAANADNVLARSGKHTKGLKGESLDDAVSFGKARAKQNMDDLQAVCELCELNPSPENLKLKKDLILKCQSDKQTMYLLKNADDEFTSVRKEFNNTMEKIYKDTDDAVLSRLQAEYGGEIKVGNASSSSKAKLKSGQTITYDRDITYYRKNAQGEWVAINDQEHIEKLYRDAFQEKATGIKKTSTSDLNKLSKEGVDINKYQKMEDTLASKYGTKMDQTNVQDVLHHSESYGEDLQRALDPKLHKEALVNPNKVGDAVTFKGKERFARGEALLKEAELLTDPVEKLAKQSDAIGEMLEGCRQQVKVFDNFVDSRDIARIDINGASRISDNLRAAIEVMRTAEKGTTTLGQIDTALAALGYTRDMVAEEMGDVVRAIG
ncbi:MAG: hypothetical protein IKQ62_07910 [Bacteroidaceae bacterium]|nr:hypothetical protein [Bacteroidaceae bacterium]